MHWQDSVLDSIPQCNRLVSLDLSHNAIKEEGMSLVARSALRCVSLTALNLGDCFGGESGLLAIAEACRCTVGVSDCTTTAV